MIICFSGTGNSRRVADQLQDLLGDGVVRLAPGQMSKPERITIDIADDRLIWVMPVHAWGIPRKAVQMMRQAKFVGNRQAKHYLVLTCGDDIGYADRQWRSIMRARGFEDAGAYSVQMPNSYVLLPGFDVDPVEVQKSKLNASIDTVEAIAKSITEEENTTRVVRGTYPWVKSKILYPLFHQFLCSTKPFHANDACEGCGKCMRNCSIGNISMVDGKPQWGNVCNTCLRCYHCCPKHAVEYGNRTHGKGQYLCPGYTLN